jgi:hypothetical protein
VGVGYIALAPGEANPRSVWICVALGVEMKDYVLFTVFKLVVIFLVCLFKGGFNG